MSNITRIALVLAALAVAPWLAACGQDASAQPGQPAPVGGYQAYVGAWSGPGSTLTVTASGYLTAHLVDPGGSVVDVSGQIQDVTASSIVVRTAEATTTVPVVTPPQEVGGRTTMAIGGVESGSVALVRN